MVGAEILEYRVSLKKDVSKNPTVWAKDRRAPVLLCVVATFRHAFIRESLKKTMKDDVNIDKKSPHALFNF